MRLMAAILASTLVLASQVGAREASVAMAWPELGAIPPGAEALFEFSNADGARLAERRVPLAVGQTSLRAEFSEIPGAATSLRAGVVVQASVVAVTPARTLPDAGPIRLDALEPRAALALGFSQRLHCDGGLVDFAYTETGALWLHWQGQTLELAPLEPAQADWFANADSDAWMRPPQPQLRIDGQELGDCAPVLGPSLLPLAAAGKTREWELSLTPETITLSPNWAETALAAPLPVPTQSPGRLAFSTRDFDVVLTDAICHDRISGMPHPVAVELVLDGEVLRGCGGPPEQLLQGPEWQVVRMFGVPIDAELDAFPELTMTFAGEQISGRAACNLYVGDVRVSRDGLSFGQMATTRAACPTALQTLERRFLDGLDSVTRFDMAGPRLVVFYAGQAPILTAQRPAPGE